MTPCRTAWASIRSLSSCCQYFFCYNFISAFRPLSSLKPFGVAFSCSDYSIFLPHPGFIYEKTWQEILILLHNDRQAQSKPPTPDLKWAKRRAKWLNVFSTLSLGNKLFQESTNKPGIREPMVYQKHKTTFLGSGASGSETEIKIRASNMETHVR